MRVYLFLLSSCITVTEIFHCAGVFRLGNWKVFRCPGCKVSLYSCFTEIKADSGSVVLNLFYIFYPFYQIRLPDLLPVHSMLVNLLIYGKYEMKKILQFGMIYQNLHWLQFMLQ